MQKTYAEIIDETLAAGYTRYDRANDAAGYCYYINPDSGRMCAVGRCCIAPQDDWTRSWTTLKVAGRAIEADERELLLKPEYRGHSAFFWMDLQGLHDGIEHWSETGLSDAGLREVDRLRSKWCQHDSTN